MTGFFTPERITEGHSDKVCDQIADGICIFEEKHPREQTDLVSPWVQ